MPIFRRGEVWHYRIQIQGRKYRGSTYTSDKSAALRIYAKLRLEAAQEVHFPKAREMTLGEALLKYYEEHAIHLPSAYTIDRQIERIQKIGAKVLLSEITDAVVSEYVAGRRGELARNKKSRVGNGTINREVTLLRAVMRRAKDNWGAACAAVNWKLHLLPEKQERRSYLTATEQANLLSSLRADFRPLVRFCLMTGARLGSAVSLTWRHVDFDGKTITFKRMKGGGEHTIPLTLDLMLLLANEKHHPVYVFTYECAEDKPSRIKGVARVKGERYPFSRDGWRRPWQRALKDCGLTGFRFHDLRHTAGSRITKDSGIAVAQVLLGHTDITTTRRYSHVLMDDVRAAMERTEKRVKDTAESPVDEKSNKANDV